MPTEITESLFPRPDFKQWLTYDKTDATDPDERVPDNHDPDMESHNHAPQSDTQSDGHQNPQPKDGGKRSAHEPTKFQMFGDGRTRLTYLNLDRTSIVFQQRMSPRRADLTKERIQEMEKSFAEGVSQINTSERSQEHTWQYWWTHRLSHDEQKKILALPGVEPATGDPYQTAPNWGKEINKVHLFLMMKETIEKVFPKSGLKGMQRTNLFFDHDGNDGRPVVFNFPDMANPSQQL
jgi:hypothetical protein